MARLGNINKISKDDLCQFVLEKQRVKYWEPPASFHALKQLFNFPTGSIPVNWVLVPGSNSRL